MKKLTIIAASAALAACATDVAMVPVGGSRSDGVVRLAFEYGALQKPRIDAQAALASATERCKAWGYESADPFGGQTTQCTFSNQYGCMRMMVTVEFQCGGAAQPS